VVVTISFIIKIEIENELIVLTADDPSSESFTTGSMVAGSS